MMPLPRRKNVDRNNLVSIPAGSKKRSIIADPQITPEPMDDSFHKISTAQTWVLIPHALSTHQPRTASKTVNIAAKKRMRLKRREKGITRKASPPRTTATAPRAHLPSLCKLGTSSVFILFAYGGSHTSILVCQRKGIPRILRR